MRHNIDKEKMAEWKPSSSFLMNAAHEMNPANWSFFDYAGLATAGYVGGLAKVAAAGEPVVLPAALTARMTEQLKDPLNLAFGFPVTGVWAEGSAVKTAAESGGSVNAGLSDLALSGLNVAVSIGAGALLATIAPEAITLALASSLAGIVAQKFATAALETWDANHPANDGLSSQGTNADGISFTHTSFANGDFIDELSDGSKGYFDANSRTKTNIDANGSVDVETLDSLNNVISKDHYDANGNPLSSEISGSGNVVYDGNTATVTGASGQIDTVLASKDAAGNLVVGIKGGNTLIFDHDAGHVQVLDAGGNEQATVTISVGTDKSTTYVIEAADGGRSIQTVSPDGLKIVAESFGSNGEALVQTTRTVDPSTGAITFASDNLSDSSYTTTTISADGNETHTNIINLDGSTSDTLLEAGESGIVKATIQKVATDGSTSTDVRQIDFTGKTISDTIKAIDANGTTSVITQDADTTSIEITDILGNKEVGIFNSNGTQHIEWSSLYGTHGTKDVDSAGNTKTDIYVHLQGTDLDGTPLLIHVPQYYPYQEAELPYQKDIHYSIEQHADGSGKEVYEKTLIGGLVKSGETLVPEEGISGWTQLPTTTSPGIFREIRNIYDDNHHLIRVDTYLDSAIYDKNAIQKESWQVELGSDGTRQSNNTTSEFSSDFFSFETETAATNVMAGDEDNIAFATMDDWWNWYAGQLKKFTPNFTVPDINEKISMPNFGSPNEVNQSGTLQDDILNAHLTGSNDLVVTGNGLDNIIVANDGNDTLIAGSGNTTLMGGIGNTTFVTGDGDVAIIGGAGHSEIYINGRGNVTVKQSKASDVLRFGHEILSADITATSAFDANGNVKYLIRTDTGQEITLQAGSQALDHVALGDGTMCSLAQILYATDPAATTGTTSKSLTLPGNVVKMTAIGTEPIIVKANALDDIIIANDAGDTLLAGIGSNTLVAGHGNDTLVGNRMIPSAGVTTYSYALGDGHTTILNSNASDVLQLGNGIGLQDLKKVQVTDAAGNYITSLISANGLSIDINEGQYNSGGLENLRFSDNTEVSIYDIASSVASSAPATVATDDLGALNVKVIGNQGGEIHLGKDDANVYGSTSSEYFFAGAGHARIFGGGGADWFYSGTGDADFNGGTGGAMFIINAESGNVTISNSTSSDQLVFAGDVSHEGFSAKTVSSPDGSIRYIISTPEHGTVTINSTGGDLLNAIQFGSFDYTTLSDLLLLTDPNAVITSEALSFVPTGVVKLTLTGNADLSVKGNELNDIIVANNGNDTLIAGPGRTTLVAGLGENTLIGNNGRTTYQYDLGDGLTKILNSTASDEIHFGAGISFTDLKVSEIDQGDGHKILHLEADSNPILEIQEAADGTSVNSIQFADGTATSIDHLSKIPTTDDSLPDTVIMGTSGNDRLVAGAGHTTLIGNGGFDQFISGSGDAEFVGGDNSNYFIEPGSGNIHIATGGADSRLIFDRGIDPSTISAHTIQEADGSVTYSFAVDGQGVVSLASAGNGTTQLPDIMVFNTDGTAPSLTVSNLLAAHDPAATISTDSDLLVPAGVVNVNLTGMASVTVHGNELDDVIVANDGNDILFAGTGLWTTLVAGHGSDTLVGNGISTTYQYDLGDGRATIVNSTDGDNIQLGPNISLSDLSVTTGTSLSGAQLVELSISSGGHIDILLNDSGSIVDEIDFSNGTWASLSEMLASASSATSDGATIIGQATNGAAVI
jgi:Ca2+-binding RTX toxin-like protein